MRFVIYSKNMHLMLKENRMLNWTEVDIHLRKINERHVLAAVQK